MSNGSSDPNVVTVGHLHAAIARAELWLSTVKAAIATLPVDMPIELSPDSEAASALRELQPKFPDGC